MKILKPFLCASAGAFLSIALFNGSLSADITVLYQNDSDIANISQVNSSPGDSYAVETIDGSGIFGDGDALRVWDGTATDKPEAWWDLGTTITDGLRLDMTAAILNLDAGNTDDINWRFGNSNTSRPTSSARTFTTISFEQDGSLKPNGSTQGDFAAGPLELSFIINNHATNSLTYELFGSTQTVAPLSIDTWVDGTLEDANRDFSGNVGSSIVVADGINELGFTGSSDADLGMEFVYDNVILYTGADISTAAVPEPGSAVLLLSGLFSLGLIRRRS